MAKKRDETSDSSETSKEEVATKKKQSRKKIKKSSTESDITSSSSSEEEAKKKKKKHKKKKTSSSEEEEKKPKREKKKDSSEESSSSSDRKTKKKKKNKRKTGSSDSSDSSESSSSDENKRKKKNKPSTSRQLEDYEKLKEDLSAKFERIFQAKNNSFEATKKREMEELRRQKEELQKELELVSKLRLELEEQRKNNKTPVALGDNVADVNTIFTNIPGTSQKQNDELIELPSFEIKAPSQQIKRLAPKLKQLEEKLGIKKDKQEESPPPSNLEQTEKKSKKQREADWMNKSKEKSEQGFGSLSASQSFVNPKSLKKEIVLPSSMPKRNSVHQISIEEERSVPIRKNKIMALNEDENFDIEMVNVERLQPETDPLQEFLPDWISLYKDKIKEILLDQNKKARTKAAIINNLTDCENELKDWMTKLAVEEKLPDGWNSDSFNNIMNGLSTMSLNEADQFFDWCWNWVVDKDWPYDFGVYVACKQLEEKLGTRKKKQKDLSPPSNLEQTEKKSKKQREADWKNKEFLPDWTSPYEEKIKEILLDQNKKARTKAANINNLTGCENGLKDWMTKLAVEEKLPDGWNSDSFNDVMNGLSTMSLKEADQFFEWCRGWVVDKDWPYDFGVYVACKQLEEKLGIKREEQESCGVDARETITHPIHGLSRERTFDLVQALTRQLAFIVEDNIGRSYFLTDNVKYYTTQKEEKEKSLYPLCYDCHGRKCPAPSYSFGVCDACIHHQSKHHYTSSEADKEKIRSDIRKLTSKIDEKKKELAKLETLQEVVQTACVQFSFFRLAQTNHFSTTFINYILDTADKEKRKVEMQTSIYQKDFSEIYLLSLKSFADVFRDRLAKAKSDGYDKEVTRRSVAEQILQLSELEDFKNRLLPIINEIIYPNVNHPTLEIYPTPEKKGTGFFGRFF